MPLKPLYLVLEDCTTPLNAKLALIRTFVLGLIWTQQPWYHVRNPPRRQAWQRSGGAGRTMAMAQGFVTPAAAAGILLEITVHQLAGVADLGLLLQQLP